MSLAQRIARAQRGPTAIVITLGPRERVYAERIAAARCLTLEQAVAEAIRVHAVALGVETVRGHISPE